MAKLFSCLSILKLPNNVIGRCSCRSITATSQSFFKSKYSLDKIYPNSTLNISQKSDVPLSGEKFSGFIPMDKLSITYSASSGPGGQNVNKVHTKVDLRFHVETADWIPDKLRPKMLELYKNMINKEGFMVMKSDRTRYQIYNVADCLDKLRVMIRNTEEVEHPAPTNDEETLALRRHESATRNRLREKRFHSDVKNSRGASSL